RRVQTLERHTNTLRILSNRPLFAQVQFNQMQEAVHDGSRQRLRLAHDRPGKPPCFKKEKRQPMADGVFHAGPVIRAFVMDGYEIAEYLSRLGGFEPHYKKIARKGRAKRLRIRPDANCA